MVIVLNLVPVRPGPQSVIVDSIGMLYGIHTTGASWAKAGPLKISERTANALKINCTIVPVIGGC